jgi:DNA ligase-associated metallophosphoesterase
MKLLLQDQSFELLSEKALYNEDTRSLIIADMHLGKAAHFRKNGIAIPLQSAQKDYQRLKALINQLEPKEVIFLGDLFHSAHNAEWEVFSKIVLQMSHIDFLLVKGNHDILHEKYYTDAGFTIIKNEFERDGIIYSHKPLLNIPEDIINIAGHIHPGYTLIGKAHDHLRLPCFYLLNNCFIMPAFGSLTGLYTMDHDHRAKVFLVLKNKVVKL